MKKRMICMILALMLLMLAGCAAENKDDTKEPTITEENEIGEFRPVDCGVMAQQLYQYPFIGLEIELGEAMLEKMNTREVFAYTQEDYVDEKTVSYAQMRFSKTTAEQREETAMSVDIFAWEEALEKIGAIGVYRKDVVSKLDELTMCDTHQKFGESTDGEYEYYLSTSSAGDVELTALLSAAQTMVTEMHELDMNLGYSAFAMDREQGISNVGTFTTKDVSGKECTEAVFADYDLTLVNLFATWCSPCVEEIPELEELRKEYAEKGIRLGVVAVVMDTRLDDGSLDEDAIERAATLAEKCDLGFPMLIPDEGNMNGRLVGIESYPESFFVDSAGNIVSEPYIGANSKEGWQEIMDAELEKLG